MLVLESYESSNSRLVVGGVGVEPTHPGETDLQSAAPLRLRRPPIDLPHLTLTDFY